jgi:hypothetical protein
VSNVAPEDLEHEAHEPEADPQPLSDAEILEALPGLDQLAER